MTSAADRFAAWEWEGCPKCGEPLLKRHSREDFRTSCSGSGHMDDIEEEATYTEVEELVCEQCGVVAVRRRQIEIERSWYSHRQDVEEGEWRYAIPEEKG